MKKEKILVVGGAGYLGSVLCRKLLSNGYKVVVLDNLIYGDYGIKDLYKNKDFVVKNGDIRNIQDIIQSIRGVDGVIHLAALVGDPASALNPEETIEINHVCAKTLAGLCKYRKIKKFIFASTCSVYGTNVDNQLLTEESPLNPLSLYSKMKLKTENEILEMGNSDFKPTILRMATLYGSSPRMRFDLVINAFTIKAIKEKVLPIFGGNQSRCFCHVDDACQAYIKCLNSDKVGNNIYNVSTENYKILDLGGIIIDLVPDSELKIEEKKIDERNYMTTANKLIKDTGFNSEMAVEKGILDMIKNINKGYWDDYNNNIYDNYKYLKAWRYD